MPTREETPSAESTPRRGCRVSLLELILIGMLMTLVLIALTPWYRARETRTNVARVKADMRTLATAVMSYSIDYMSFPASGIAEGPQRTLNLPMYQALFETYFGTHSVQRGGNWAPVIPSPVPTVHSSLPQGSGARRMITFRTAVGPGPYGPTPHTLTTPISYIQEYPPDPFASTPGATFGYYNPSIPSMGWILWSPGPDRDENDPNGPADIGGIVETLYNPTIAQPSATLIDYYYDATNGTYSDGDIFRVRN